MFTPNVTFVWGGCEGRENEFWTLRKHTKLKQRNELLTVGFPNRDRPKTSLWGNIWGQDHPVRQSFTPSKDLSEPAL